MTAIPLKATFVAVDIAPGIVETTVSQVFANDSGATLECVYLFPLPTDATITDMELRFSDRIVRSEVKEKEAARADYDAAKAEGRKAALLESHRPNLFSTSVASFRPGETVEVRLSYAQELVYRQDRYEYRFPMVAGERYFPSAPTSPEDAIPEGFGSGRRIDFDIQAIGLPIRAVRSPSHDILAAPQAENSAIWDVMLAEPDAIPDRDLVLDFELFEAEAIEPTYLRFASDSGEYGLISVFPPRLPPNPLAARAPRDVVFLIDRSGSMDGERIAQAKEGAKRCLARLARGDRFNICFFDDTFEFYAPSLLDAAPDEIEKALRYLEEMSDSGGTVMQPALKACLQHLEEFGRDDCILVFMTDGDVGDERQLIGLLDRSLGSTRIFTLGIGDAPNEFLIKEMATRGNGQASFVDDPSEVASEVETLFLALDAPALSNIELSFFDEAGDRMEIDYFPRPIAPLYAGRPLQVAFRSDRGAPALVELQGERAGARVSIALDPGRALVGPAVVETLFGRRWLDRLNAERYAAESDADRARLREEIIEASLLFGLVSDFTSRVAVEVWTTTPPPEANAVSMPRAISYDASGEVFELSPFTVDGADGQGYRATSTLAGTRIRTDLKDVGVAISVVTEEFLRDVAATSTSDLLLYASGSEVAGVGGNFDEATLPMASAWGALGDHSLVDARRVERVEAANSPVAEIFSGGLAFGPRSARNYVTPGDSEGLVAIRSGDAGYLDLWADFSEPLLEEAAAVAFSASQTLAERDRRGAQLAAMAGVAGKFRLEGRFDWREIASLVRNDRAAVSANWSPKDWLAIDYEFVWNEVSNDAPFAFSLGREGSADADALASEEAEFLGHASELSERIHALGALMEIGSAWRQHVYVAARRYETDRAMRFAGGAGERTDATSDDLLLYYRLATPDERLQLGASARRSWIRRSFSFADAIDEAANLEAVLQVTDVFSAMASYAVAERTPLALSRGLIWNPVANDWIQAPMLRSSESEGAELGLAARGLDGRLSVEIAVYRRQNFDAIYRDWASEAALRAALATDAERQPIDALWRNFEDYRQAGARAELYWQPISPLSIIASYFEDWEAEGPVDGGNRRASLFSRYEIGEGILRGLAVGGGFRYRNEVSFNDGYTLPGAWQWDAFARYEFGGSDVAMQLNFRNLGNASYKSDRFSTDRGAETFLMLEKRF